MIVTNKAFIDKNINETVVHGSIGFKPGIQYNSGFGYIPESKLEELLKTGLVKDYFVVSAFDYDTLNIRREGEIREINRADYLTGKYYDANPPAMNVISTNKEYNSGEALHLSGLNIEDMEQWSLHLL